MKNEFESKINGYGAFGSIEDFAQAVERRKQTGQSLTGTGEIFLGAKFLTPWEMENPYGNYPRLTVNVLPEGELQIISDEPLPRLGPWEILD